MSTVEVSGVTRRFGAVEALAPVDLRIESGRVVTLLGPSGCGKTTLLRIIGGLESATAGTVTVDGATPAAARAAKRIGLVPQSPGLLPWRTVRANARLLLDLNRSANGRGSDRPTAQATRVGSDVEALLAEVGLDGFADAFPHGMGHHLGLETHDASPDEPLAEGAVVTIEPGIYLQGECIGIRIEDDVLVTESGCEVLTRETPKAAADIEALVGSG